jgi:hypothetical protein
MGHSLGSLRGRTSLRTRVQADVAPVIAIVTVVLTSMVRAERAAGDHAGRRGVVLAEGRLF